MNRVPIPLRAALYHASRPSPARRLAAAGYRALATAVARRLSRLEGTEISLRSHCLEAPAPALSDLDFLVKVPLPPTAAGRRTLRQIRRTYRSLARRWPLLGEVTWWDGRVEALWLRDSPGLRLLYENRLRFDGKSWTPLAPAPDPIAAGNRFSLAFSAYGLGLRYAALARNPGWGNGTLHAHRMRRAFGKAIAFAEGRGIPRSGEGPEPTFENAFRALDRLAREAGAGPKPPPSAPHPRRLAAEHAAETIRLALAPRWPLARLGGRLVGEFRRPDALFADWLKAVGRRAWTREYAPLLLSPAMARRPVADRRERLFHLAVTLGGDLIHAPVPQIERTLGSLAAEGFSLSGDREARGLETLAAVLEALREG